jgi:hypothetical protein
MVFMFSIEDNTISAEKCLGMVFAALHITIKQLDVPTVAVALHIVVVSPVLENRGLLRHFIDENEAKLLVTLNLLR